MNMITPSHQKGVVLIAALGMLILLTMLGMGAARIALQEEKISTSQRLQTAAFEVAGTGLEAVNNDALRYMGEVLNGSVTIDLPTLSDLDSVMDFNLTSDMSLSSITPPSGYSMGGDQFVAYSFRVHADGELTQTDGVVIARSDLDQGLLRIGPGLQQ